MDARRLERHVVVEILFTALFGYGGQCKKDHAWVREARRPRVQVAGLLGAW